MTKFTTKADIAATATAVLEGHQSAPDLKRTLNNAMVAMIAACGVNSKRGVTNRDGKLRTIDSMAALFEIAPQAVYDGSVLALARDILREVGIPYREVPLP
jgi:hypothetical protein